MVTESLVIDGGATIPLSGGGTTRILSLRPPYADPPPAFPVLTVQNLTFTAGYTGHLPANTTDSGGAGVALTNSIVADNAKVFLWENTSCNLRHDGSGSVQWRDSNTGGQAELPCAGVSFFDPQLGPLQNNGGPTPTIMPGTVSDSATDCPATDQRGLPRSIPCTPGAVELPQ